MALTETYPTETATAEQVGAPPKGSVVTLDVNEIVNNFERVRSEGDYTTRNYLIDLRTDAFEGRHWESEPEEETDFQLVLNYVRNTILRFNAILAREPKPKVPIPGTGSSPEATSHI